MGDHTAGDQRFEALHDRIIQMAAARGAVAKPRKLRRKLRKLREGADPLAYREALILLNCMGRLSPSRTRRHLVRLAGDLVAVGDTARLDRLMGLMRDVLHPVALTAHGYNATFAQLDAGLIYRSMGAALAPLAALGLPFYLYAGALLGHVRDGRLIDHDDDLDCAVMLGECAPGAVGVLWREVKVQLAAMDLLTEASTASSEPVFKMKTDLGITVDIFPSWTHEGRFSVYPYALNDMDPAHVLPLTGFGQEPLMFPADPEAFLTQCYGPGWRVPDPFFQIDWPGVERRFASLWATDYALTRAGPL